MLSGLLLMLGLLLPTLGYAEPHPAGDILDYRLQVSFDIQASQIRGHARIAVKKGQELNLQKGNLHIIDLHADGKKIDIAGRVETISLQPFEDGFVEIRYVGTFRSPERPEGVAARATSRLPNRLIDLRGIFLDGVWYPKPDRMCTYRLTVTLPSEYEAVSEAETVATTIREGQKVISFTFPHPLDSLSFVATSRYQITKDRFNDTEIFAYFFPEDEKLALSYIEHTKKYLKLYEELFGKFPYNRFSVVENFLPTGYSLPTYALLGQSVVRLPFIVETALGHEILHQWFGDSVYVDDEKGNWAEGLTTYLADHLYEEQKGRGFEYRKEALIQYQSYVNEKNEFPLRDFHERVNRSSQAIGYGKAFMVFHMLENYLGQEHFHESLRYFVREMRFKRASWEDLQRAFEAISQRDLKWFFRQWVDEKGVADLRLEEDVKVKPRDGKFEVEFTITQKPKAYKIDLPVSFYSALGRVTHLFPIDKEKNHLKILLDDWPRKLVIDEDYDLARTLVRGELPPVIARLFAENPSILVLPPSGEKVYQTVIERFKKRGARVEEAGQVKDADLRTSSLIILGEENSLAERLYGRVGKEAGFDLIVKENPWNRKKVIGIFRGKSKKEVDEAFPKMFHYGQYSEVSFEQGRNVYKMTETTDRGMVKELLKQTPAVEVPALKDLAGVVREAEERKVFYVGETHDQFSHHVVQLEVIKSLHQKKKKVAIGMEMFQRPFQGALDDYIDGRIEEKELLKNTEYFKRWKYDYNLYRPILQYARAEKIPVVALNIQTEIVEKVAQSGLESLTEEEKKFVPAQMDFSDEAYRERLRKIFQEHKNFPAENFDLFCQAQILWDETMAESIDSFFKKNPEYQMVVLAGNGHLSFGSGIPKRAAQRNGYDYAILLNGVEIEKDVANFLLYPEVVPIEGSPKLGVFLREEKGQVVIQGFSSEGGAEKAGMREGDVILSLDQRSIHTVDEARLELLYKKRGEPVKVRISRKEPQGGEKEMEFEVTPR